MRSRTNLDGALAAWGSTCPEWMVVLARACDEGSQRGVAEVIGYSPTTVNQVLKGRYKGGLAAIEQAVRGAYMGVTVGCPILGEIPTARCREERNKPFANTSNFRVTLWRACQGCNQSS